MQVIPACERQLPALPAFAGRSMHWAEWRSS